MTDDTVVLAMGEGVGNLLVQNGFKLITNVAGRRSVITHANDPRLKY